MQELGMAQGALDGLRLIELGQLIAGPFCGQLMADHGAEVIKIEPPHRPGDVAEGDPMRQWGRGKPLWFPVVGRNKKTITLNLRDSRGQELLRKLVKKSDFLLENFRPGTLEKWGLGYDTLSADNPGLIMIRVSGYGQTGPYAPRAGYGSIGEAMGGIRNLAGDPSTPPSRVGLSIGDSLAATFACLGAIMALHHRHRTGQGQVVDSAIYEAVLAMMESTVPEYTEAGFVRERTGSILPGVAPSNAYPCSDGDILIGANQNSVFARLAEAMGRPELAKDPRYATHLARGENQDELDTLISDWTRPQPSADVLDLMETHGVPAGKIYKAPDMLADPHFAAREALVKVAHPDFANLVMQNVFPKLSATPGKVNWPGQPMGAHNHEIYNELLGLSDDDIRGLAQEGVI
jgi:crotonobetainyl-CoA:carnitine CoA-transferase CaiB-like acyl-CoA transferase